MIFFGRKKKYAVGLTLSGGGLRGIGHIGALKALEEHGLKPSILSGTSAGAIIAAFYASGYTPQEMLSIALASNLFSRSSLRFRVSGFFDTGFLLKLFNDHMPEGTLENLKIPLYIAVTDIVGAKIEYIHHGRLDKALLASACLPFVFAPIKEGNKTYMDGGIMNNLPIEPIRDKCGMLIGSHVNSLERSGIENMGAGKIIDRVIHMALGNSVYYKSKACNLFIDPPDMTQFGIFDKKNIQRIHDHVYDYTTQLLKNRKEKTSWFA